MKTLSVAELHALTAKRRRPRNLEGPLQAEIVAALRDRGLMAFAIPNGGKRALATAKRLKVEGVQAGVPDICVPMPSARTVWLEVKHGRGATSAAQDAMHARLRLLGHRVEVVRSVADALAVFATATADSPQTREAHAEGLGSGERREGKVER